MCVDIRHYQTPKSGSRRECCRWSHSKRMASAVGWLLPSAALVLMPKCPACFAAYFAAATGLGLSLSTAAHLRSATLAVCTVGLMMSLVLIIRWRRLSGTWHLR